MHTIFNTNVNDALQDAVYILRDYGIKEISARGDVWVYHAPVMRIYTAPCERVLFSAIRDANPFFHIAESIWMLHGDNDAKFLNYFIKDFGERFAEQDGIIHGAYGDRWRNSFGIDQIQVIIKKLKKNPKDRRVVLLMWDSNFYGENDLEGIWEDIPCNTQAYFRIFNNKLEMTTTSRSHDAIWGATGANAVHFSFLQEYLAEMIGVGVGRFYQFSNNYHMYDDVFQKLLKKADGDLRKLHNGLYDNCYFTHSVTPFRLVTDPSSFDEELRILMDSIRHIYENLPYIVPHFKNEFLSDTVWNMLFAYWIYKMSDANTALGYADKIVAPDWRLAARQWLERRVK